MDMRFKHVLRTLLATLAVVAALPAAIATAAPVPARSASDFVESIGVDTHLGYDDTAYVSGFPTVEQRLGELGVHHIRDGLMAGRPDEYARLNALAAAGVHSTLIMGSPTSDDVATLTATLKSQLLPSVEAVEGPNEYDLSGNPAWSSALAGYQAHLYSAIKSDPALASLPVVGPSVVLEPSEKALGSLAGSVDYGNVHSYPQGAAPEANVGEFIARGALNAPGKPVEATETGYHNAMGWTGEGPPVSEAAAAVYMPRLFLDYFGEGISRTFAYELVDEGTDGAQKEQNWGLLHADLSPKPAFTALRNLISIVGDEGPAGAPGSVDYDLSGDTRQLHTVLLQRGDGTFDLALWRAEEVNAAGAGGSAAPVTLSLARSVQSVERYEPTLSAAPQPGGVERSAGSLTVGVGADVTILHLELGETLPTGRVQLWVAQSSVPAGGRVAVRGKLPGRAHAHRRVSFQRWDSKAHRWVGVGSGRALASGRFRKKLKIARGVAGTSRLRVIAAEARPSRAVRLHVRRA